MSPDSRTFTRLSIWRMMISMCLSWIDTPCERYTSCTSCHQVLLHRAGAEDAQHLVRVHRAGDELLADARRARRRSTSSRDRIGTW